MSDNFILSVMGESEIETFDVQISHKRSPSELPSLEEDQINWLGSMLDCVAEEELTDTQKADIAYVSESYILKNLKSDFKGYVLLLVLREKWPVGQKAKFKVKADKVGASHTYIPHICEPQPIEPSPDETQIKTAEDKALASQLAFLKKNKKRFANSSAVHAYIGQNR